MVYYPLTKGEPPITKGECVGDTLSQIEHAIEELSGISSALNSKDLKFKDLPGLAEDLRTQSQDLKEFQKQLLHFLKPTSFPVG